jgi:hypothetical protein
MVMYVLHFYNIRYLSLSTAKNVECYVLWQKGGFSGFRRQWDYHEEDVESGDENQQLILSWGKQEERHKLPGLFYNFSTSAYSVRASTFISNTTRILTLGHHCLMVAGGNVHCAWEWWSLDGQCPFLLSLCVIHCSCIISMWPKHELDLERSVRKGRWVKWGECVWMCLRFREKINQVILVQ